MNTTTLFSFGYWGWGNATERLVQLVDAVERNRGFKPPLFVDIRIRRSVRAVGFRDGNFAEAAGRKRYSWLKSLGNKRIVTKRGAKVQIANPAGAVELLDVALEAAADRRRVIFFCSCELPRWAGKPTCHRVAVAKLVVQEAQDRKLPVAVAEWPGQESREIDLALDERTIELVLKNRFAIPLGTKVDLPALGSLGLGSVATLHGGKYTVRRVVDRMVWRKEQWQLPIREWYMDPGVGIADYRRLAKTWQSQLDFCMASI